MTGGVLVSIFEADANRALRLGWFGRALSALFGKPSPEQTGHYWSEVAEPGPLNCLEADIPTVCNGSRADSGLSPGNGRSSWEAARMEAVFERHSQPIDEDAHPWREMMAAGIEHRHWRRREVAEQLHQRSVRKASSGPVARCLHETKAHLRRRSARTPVPVPRNPPRTWRSTPVRPISGTGWTRLRRPSALDAPAAAPAPAQRTSACRTGSPGLQCSPPDAPGRAGPPSRHPRP